jgi:hypothetical protein
VKKFDFGRRGVERREEERRGEERECEKLIIGYVNISHVYIK